MNSRAKTRTKRRAKTRKRTRRAGARRGAERVSNLEAGVFVLLPKDAQEYEPLYLIIEDNYDGTYEAISCPPIHYPKPDYYIRGRQVDTMFGEAFHKMVVFNKLKDAGEHYILSKGSYNMTIPKDWTYENAELWDTMTQTF
jgi:hypothetical protein